MQDNLFSLISGCSEPSRQNIKKFLQELFTTQDEESQEESQKLEILFLRVTHNFSISRIRQISKNERCKKDLTDYQFNYGEITFRTIHKIISKIKTHRLLGQEEIFYDLGSGSGKVLFAASLCHSFRKCIGVQYLQSLYSTSIELRDKIAAEAGKLEEEVNEILPQSYSLPIIEIYNQDFQNYNWSNGTVIFVSSTCYTRDVMSKISDLCSQLKIGTILITLTRPIDAKAGWKVLEKFQGETSWGACTVFIHERKP